MMRAFQVAQWGVDQLRSVELPRPEPGPTEVLVRVKAVGLNPIDIVALEGRGHGSLTTPFIPCWDVAGIIETLGYGVTRFKTGDEVYGFPRFPAAAHGCAEYITSPARHLSLKPKNLAFGEAAGVPLAGLTAWQMLNDAANVKRGDKVLITGAAGGCGHLAVQIAKSMGAHVTAVASKTKLPFVRSLGADRVIDYTNTLVENEVRDMDVVIEFVGGEFSYRMLKTLHSDGMLVTAHARHHGARLGEEASRLGVRASWFLCEPDHCGLDKLKHLFEAGTLQISLSDKYPFDKARVAFDQQAQQHSTGYKLQTKRNDEKHATGKIVIEL